MQHICQEDMLCIIAHTFFCTIKIGNFVTNLMCKTSTNHVGVNVEFLGIINNLFLTMKLGIA